MQELLKWLASLKGIEVEEGAKLRLELSSFPSGGLALLVLIGVVLALYLGIMIRGLMIAHASKDQHGAYLVFGVVALFFWPIAINVAMVLNLFPVVGISLPMLSYGGSSLLTCMIAVGLAMNVSMRRYVF